ncbi:MAG: FAD:protein FMN transferase [Lentisphaerota bacterium]
MVLMAQHSGTTVSSVPLRGYHGYYQFFFQAMGTLCEIVFSSSSHAQAETFKQKALSWVGEFEARYSRFLEPSLVSRINRNAGGDWVDVDRRTEEIFAMCDWFHWTTHGVFDPTLGPLVLLWDYHNPAFIPPSDLQVEAALEKVGWSRIRREPGRVRLPAAGMSLDLGGIGKEYAVDQVVNLATSFGIKNILVNFGRDLRVAGEPPERGAWRIGLEKPDDPGRCWGGVYLNEGAVCTSGDYARYVEVDGKRYGHIIDPRSGYPVRHDARSVSVITGTCTEAGLLATTAFVLGPEHGMNFLSGQYTAEGCMWTDNGLFETRRFSKYVLKNENSAV